MDVATPLNSVHSLPSVAFLTDFGERDGFAGIMKGIVLRDFGLPLPLVDITHGIEPQNIRQGLWVLNNAFSWFGPNTVFVCVVDPHVGTAEQIPLLAWWPEKRQAFVAPDNGLLSPILDAAEGGLHLYDLRQTAFYKNRSTPASRTFYGRDLYAPAAAQLVRALYEQNMNHFLKALGEPLRNCVRITRPTPRHHFEKPGLCLEGEIIYQDTFGNLITNIPNDWLPIGLNVRVVFPGQAEIGSRCLPTYSEALKTSMQEQLIVIPSSGNTLELSVFQGHAGNMLQVETGSLVRIYIDEPITHPGEI
jgi:hypothetical protein